MKWDIRPNSLAFKYDNGPLRWNLYADESKINNLKSYDIPLIERTLNKKLSEDLGQKALKAGPIFVEFFDHYGMTFIYSPS